MGRAMSILFLLCTAISSVASCNLHKSHIDWVDCSKNVPDPSVLNVTGINLDQLPSTLHCGKIDVPMDYSRPISDCNKITLNLAMYRPKNPKGALFFCPGGTDAGAVVAWNIVLNQTSNFTFDFSGLLDYDLIVMDIRGTYASNPVNVSLDLLEPFIGQYPATQEEFDELQSASIALIQSWANLSSPPGIIQYLGTKEVAQDYEMIRKALKYDKINFLGISYGSYRAQQYASLFPEHVGNFVLDAVPAHGMDLYEQAKYEVLAANRGLLRADAYCQNDISCPFHNRGNGSVVKAYHDILELASQPSSPVPKWAFQEAIYDLLQNQPDFPYILQTMGDILAGNTSSLTSGGDSAVIDWVGMLTIANDFPRDITFQKFNKSLEDVSKLDSNTMGRSLAWEMLLLCSGWPFQSPQNNPLYTNFSMLLVTSDFDVSTPTEGTTFAWKQIPNAGLVVRHGDDHGSFNLPYQPSTEIEKQYLLTGVLPVPKNDTFVTVYTPGSIRAPIPNPYNVPTGFIAGDIDSGST